MSHPEFPLRDYLNFLLALSRYPVPMRERDSAALEVGGTDVLNTVLTAVSMCLQGGEQVDISKYVLPTTRLIELEVVMKPTGGELIIYSPGHEDKEARFSQADSFSTIPISVAILCIKALGGPFDFDLHVVAIRGMG